MDAGQELGWAKASGPWMEGSHMHLLLGPCKVLFECPSFASVMLRGAKERVLVILG